MIVSFSDKALRQFFDTGVAPKGLPAGLRRAILLKLDLLMAASTVRDLRVPPGNRYEELSGRLAGRSCLRVIRQWRIVFEWDEQNGTASNVYLDDHSYRP